MFFSVMDGGSPSHHRESDPRRTKIVLLSPSHLATPKRHFPVLMLVVLVLLVVVPMLPIAVTTKGHRLPLLLLLLPLLGMCQLLMKKRKLLSMPATPLLLHRLAPRLVVRGLSLSLFCSRVFHRSCGSPPWLRILLVGGLLLYQKTIITGLRTSGP